MEMSVICKWIRTEEELYRWSADRFNKFPLFENDIEDNYRPQLEGVRFFPLTAIDENSIIIGHFIIRYPRDDDDSSVRFGFVIVDPGIKGEMLPEICYHIRKDCQHRVYAKEAASAVRDWAFEHTDYPSLFSY